MIRSKVPAAILLILCFLATGCARSGFFWEPDPKVNKAEFFPKHFCTGDLITFVWDTEDIDKIQLYTRTGDLKFTTTQPSGTATTPPISIEMLPLKVRGYVGDDYEERTVTGLINCDNPEWTIDYISTMELMSGSEPRYEPLYTEEYETEDGSVVDVTVYRVWQRFEGYFWDIPSADFSPKTKIDIIKSYNDDRLKFTILETGESFTLSQSQQYNVQNHVHPSIKLRGEYDSPIERPIGIQRGERTKPEKEWFYYENLYEEMKGRIKMRVYCDLD
jgi:hypothetical protein